MTEPAEKFVYGMPASETPKLSADIRNNLDALAQNLFTTDPDLPAGREYMTRILNDVNDPIQAGNYRLQTYIGGTWRDVLQHLEVGLAAPSKNIVEFTTAAVSWVVDHNLGSKPAASVFGTSGYQLQPVQTFPQEVIFLGRSDLAGVLPGSVARYPVRFEGRLLEVFGIGPEGLTPAGGDIYQLEIDSTASGGALVPVTGGTITLTVPVLPGVIVPGSLPTANNIFSQQGGGGAEDVIQVTAVPAGVGVGIIELRAVVERSLQAGQYTLQHITDNRFIVSFSQATAGFVVVTG